MSLANHKTGIKVILDQSRLNQIHFRFQIRSELFLTAWSLLELIGADWSCWEIGLNFWITVIESDELVNEFYSCIILTVENPIATNLSIQFSQNRFKIVLYIWVISKVPCLLVAKIHCNSLHPCISVIIWLFEVWTLSKRRCSILCSIWNFREYRGFTTTNILTRLNPNLNAVQIND